MGDLMDFETLMTYGHETANLLDNRENLKGQVVGGVRQFGRAYGNPNHPRDKDTGQAVEDCMKLEVANAVLAALAFS
jgi:hypothetical protein